MKWFRSNIKTGSRLALFALVLQFGLSFGHFHAGAAPAAIQAAEAQSDISPATPDAVDPQASLPGSHDDSDHHPGENCALCAIIALASTVLFATPPVLRLPQAAELLYLITNPGFVHLNSARLAFQPRAPPAS